MDVAGRIESKPELDTNQSTLQSRQGPTDSKLVSLEFASASEAYLNDMNERRKKKQLQAPTI